MGQLPIKYIDLSGDPYDRFVEVTKDFKTELLAAYDIVK